MASTSDSSPEYTSATFVPLLKKLVLSPSLFTTSDVHLAFHHLAAADGASPAQIGSFLTALRLTGKDGEAEVVAAAADTMRSYATKVNVAGGVGKGLVCDIVGTGGDGQNTFNVSTTAGIVAAGAGARVYKHGNKAATSSSGSADILLSLDCPITSLPASSIPFIASVSTFLFLFAPNYHPAMIRVAPVRKSLAFPTIFNVLGPLINPARPEAMVVGVHSRSLGPIFGEALRLTGVKRAWVVCGAEGLDEISPAGITYVWSLENDVVTEMTVTPSTFGLQTHALSTVVGGTPLENASTLLTLLDGNVALDDPVENFVVMNAAAVLFISGLASSPIEGVKLARDSIKNGGANSALSAFQVASQQGATKA